MAKSSQLEPAPEPIKTVDLLLLRAQEEQAPVLSLLEQGEVRSVCLSMVQIKPTRFSEKQLQPWLSTLWDGIVLISPNAVRFFSPHTKKQGWPRAKKHYFTVGPGTAHILLEHTKQPVTWPRPQHNSDRLLELKELKQVKSERWLIINGEPGRPYIPDTLKQRGASTEVIASYTRVPLPHQGITPVFESAQTASWVAATSKEQVDLFIQYLEAKNKVQWALERNWVVPSERVAETLIQLGIPSQQLHYAPSAMANDLADTIIRLHRQLPMSTPTQQPPITKKTASRSQTIQKKESWLNRLLVAVLVLSVLTLAAGGLFLWQQQQLIQTQTQQSFQDIHTRLNHTEQEDSRVEQRISDQLQKQSQLHVQELQQTQHQEINTLKRQQTDELLRLEDMILQQERDLLSLRQRVRSTSNPSIRTMLLSEAYDRVNLATQRLKLDNDPHIALNLLRSARTILMEDSSQYRTIIRQLDDDIAMIDAVPYIDFSGTLLLLQQLQQQVPQLPLLKQKGEARSEAQQRKDASQLSNWKENLNNAWRAFSADIIRIQKDVDSHLQLNVEQRIALNSRLEMLLQLAQQALVLDQPDVFNSSIRDALELAQTYLNTHEPLTQQFTQALKTLQTLQLDIEFPSHLLSRAMLRERLLDLETQTNNEHSANQAQQELESNDD